ncbi:MAG: 4Fe-4S dicluster domain-containing protein [Thermoprotei archaeon]|nr:4Fe-4S dicluster domain-containing protein [Thermoprotei archaeon]
MRLAYVWDSRRCISCMACVVACASANYPEFMFKDKPNPQWNWLASNIRVVVREKDGRPEIRLRLLSCQHCENPPCVDVCPTGASYIDKRTGLVKIDHSRCIGCRACIVACPYNARWLNPITLQPEKCPGPLCSRTLPEKAVCVEVCPAGARLIGDLDDPRSPVNEVLRRYKVGKYKVERMKEHLGTSPKWFVITG